MLQITYEIYHYSFPPQPFFLYSPYAPFFSFTGLEVGREREGEEGREIDGYMEKGRKGGERRDTWRERKGEKWKGTCRKREKEGREVK